MANLPLRYPYEALLDNTDYLRIDILDYKKNKGKGDGLIRTVKAFDGGVLEKQNYKERINSIFLPMPSNIQDGNSVSYGDSSLDGLTAQVFSAVKPTFEPQSFNGIAQALSNVLNNTTKVISSPEALDIFNKSLAAQASNIPFGGNLTVNDVLARQDGRILNPNMELLFNGVTLRSFKFSFKMTPRNITEAEQILLIIRTLRTNMAPSGRFGTFLQTPHLFQLSYRTGPDIHKYLNKFKFCFLQDMSVNYTGENVYATYSDGSPVSYIMDLGFKEIEPIYHEDYNPDTAGQLEN